MTKEARNNFYEALRKKQHGDDFYWLAKASILDHRVVIVVDSRESVKRFRQVHSKVLGDMHFLRKFLRLFVFKSRKPKVVSLDSVGYGVKVPKIYSQSAVLALLRESK